MGYYNPHAYMFSLILYKLDWVEISNGFD